MIERGGQFFVGNNLTWADLHVFAVLDRLRVDNPEVGGVPKCEYHQSYFDAWIILQLLEDFPRMKNLLERIEVEPNISKWLNSRPQTLL